MKKTLPPLKPLKPLPSLSIPRKEEIVSLTGDKRTDLIIMESLGDRELLSLCSTNTYANNLCHLEAFWQDRAVKRFGGAKATLKPMGQTWRNFYLSNV